MRGFKEALPTGIGRTKHRHIVFVDDEAQTASTSFDDGHTHEVQWVPITLPQIDEAGNTLAPAEYGWQVVPGEDGHTHELDEVTPLKPKKKETESEIVSEVIKLYKECIDHEDDSFQAGYESEQFYSGKGQWEETTKNELHQSNRSALTINYVGPKLDEISGHQRQGDQDIQYLPTEGGDQRVADMLNYLSKNILDSCFYPREKAKGFMDGAKVGRGWLNLYVEYNNKLEPVIKVKRYNWKRVRTSPHEMEDLEDCEVLFKERMYSKKQLEEAWPEQADKVSRFFDDEFEARTSRKHTRYTPDQYVQSDNKIMLGSEVMVDTVKQEYKVLECWRRVQRRRFLAVHVASEDVFDLSNWKQADINSLKTIEGLITVQKSKKEIRITTVAPNLLLSDEDPAILPVDDFHLIPIYCYKDDEGWWGKIEGAKDPQREINKRRSQAVDIGNSVVSHGWFYDSTTFPHNSGEVFKREATSPRFFVEVTDITRPPTQIRGGDFPPEIVTLLEMADNDINRQLNIIQREPGANTSAAAIMQAERLKLIGNEFLFANLSFAQKKLGKLLAAAIQKYYTPKRIHRILMNMKAAPSTPDVNLGGQPIADFTEEDIAALLETADLTDYDVIVSEAAYSPSVRSGVFMLMQELAKAGQVPPEMLIEFAPVPEAVKSNIKAQLAAQAQAAGQGETATANAEVEKALVAQGVIPPSVKERFGLKQDVTPAALQQPPQQYQNGGIVQG